MGFQEYEQNAIDATWMQGPKARATTGALGGAKQAALDELKAGVKMRYPKGASGDDLRLQELGITYGLDRYPGETGDQYEARLTNAFPAHQQAGTALGIVAQLQAYGLVDVEVIEDWEGTFAGGYWPSRIWVVIGPDFGSLDLRPLLLGSSWTLGNDWTLGSSATREQVQAIVRIIEKWQDFGSQLVSVIVRWPGAPLLGLDDGLGGAFILGGTATGNAIAWLVTNPLGSCLLGSWVLGTDLLP